MHLRKHYPLAVLYNLNVLQEIKSHQGSLYAEALAIAHTHSNYLPAYFVGHAPFFNTMDLMLHPRASLKKNEPVGKNIPLFVLRHAREMLLTAKMMKPGDIAAATGILTDAYMINFDMDIDTAQQLVEEDALQMDALLEHGVFEQTA